VVEPAAQVDDAELASQAKEGRRAAFAALYERRYGLVFGYFRARVLDSHQAEDLAQEVFVRVFDAIRRYNTELRFQSWLMGICRNVLREHVRHIKRRRETGWTELCIELEGLADDEGLYDDVLHLVPVCIEGLNDAAAKSLRWHYMGGLKVQKIADKLKSFDFVVYSQLKRCIKTQLEQGGSSTERGRET